jgi:uncharacterized protein (TIGR03435 family)
MQDWDDAALLREYVGHDSEEAFAILVARHVNKVYSVALRHTGNPHSAEEIAQAVFVILAKKSPHLGRRVVLSGWLYETARFTALTHVRSEIRRTQREQEAYMQTTADQSGEGDWPRVAPWLEAAMAGLNETDRHAVVLRFFDGKSMKEVGASLGANEMTARKRVNRAVEKLRRFFLKRGIVLTAAALTAAVSANSVQAAPALLSETVTAIALAKGAAASGSTFTLIKGTLKFMAWTKLKMTAAMVVGVMLVAGTTVATVKVMQHHAMYRWRTHGISRADIQKLDMWPAQVWIAPAANTNLPNSVSKRESGKIMGSDMPFSWVLRDAYWMSEHRMILHFDPPPGTYDFMANLPQGSAEALQKEFDKFFGVVVKRESIATNVLVLRIGPNGLLGFADPTTNKWGATERVDKDTLTWLGQPLATLDVFLEDYFATPIIDQTGITEKHDFALQWNEKWWYNQPKERDGLKKAILNQLGLELVATNMPLEMLVVNKAK